MQETKHLGYRFHNVALKSIALLTFRLPDAERQGWSLRGERCVVVEGRGVGVQPVFQLDSHTSARAKWLSSI